MRLIDTGFFSFFGFNVSSIYCAFAECISSFFFNNTNGN